MKNKKVIIAVILCIGAVISLIYGMTAGPKARKRSGEEAVSRQDAAVTPARRIVPTKRKAAKTDFVSWGRNPFTSEGVSAEAGTGLVLNGILWDNKKPLVIINDNVIGIGGKIGENTIVDIKKESVILNSGTGNFELRLNQ